MYCASLSELFYKHRILSNPQRYAGNMTTFLNVSIPLEMAICLEEFCNFSFLVFVFMLGASLGRQRASKVPTPKTAFDMTTLNF